MGCLNKLSTDSTVPGWKDWAKGQLNNLEETSESFDQIADAMIQLCIYLSCLFSVLQVENYTWLTESQWLMFLRIVELALASQTPHVR